MASAGFEALNKKWMDGIKEGPGGEELLYRSFPNSFFRSFSSPGVIRRPVDFTGEVLSDSIDLWVSKTDVPAIQVGNDTVRFPAEYAVGGELFTYAVETILHEDAGNWFLRCRR
jgi:hypothetical protein